MRNVGPSLLNRDLGDLRKVWLDKMEDPFSFDKDAVNRYRSSLRHLFSVVDGIKAVVIGHHVKWFFCQTLEGHKLANGAKIVANMNVSSGLNP